MAVPKEIQHNFVFAFDLTAQAVNEGRCYRCSYCSSWTQHPTSDEATEQICPQRDRRHGERRTRGRRAND